MRRCLDCPALITRGSRCPDCQARRRPAAARHQLPDAVKARDGGRCVLCGSTDRVQAHHVRPIAAGGGHRMENMATLCHSCHGVAHKLGRLEIA